MIDKHVARARLLIEQERYDLAEREVRQALASMPDESGLHALLALCLCHKNAYQEATRAAEQAVHLAPDDAFAHYVRAAILERRQHYPEAEAAIREAISLDPSDPSAFALLAQICFNQRRWQDALDAAEQGLAIDPESTICTNLRAMALVKLGRKMQAGEAIESALSRDPEDADTHANLGWTRVEQGRPQEALHHFREALRLEPNNEWARRGIVEALKARNPIYRWILAYFLWMNRLSHKHQWTVLIGLYILYRILRNVARNNPDLAPWVMPFLVAYIAFAIMTWISEPLFNLLLRLNRFGRLALNREETVIANWVGGLIAVALGSLAWYFAAGNEPALTTALAAGLTIPALSRIFHCDEGWPRNTLIAMTLGLAALGFGGSLLLHASMYVEESSIETVLRLGSKAFMAFIVAALLSQFAVNYLVQVTVRR